MIEIVVVFLPENYDARTVDHGMVIDTLSVNPGEILMRLVKFFGLVSVKTCYEGSGPRQNLFLFISAMKVTASRPPGRGKRKYANIRCRKRVGGGSM
jgi:hypothetical protein